MDFSHELKAVTLDVGGTLMTPWPSVGDVYAEVAAKHGWKIPAATLNQNFKKAWRQLGQFNHRREEWAKLVDATFANLIKVRPSETFFDELYERFAEPDTWRIFDDVKPALDSLAARGVNLGIISNWDERLRPLLTKTGLAKYFDAIVISGEVGFTKPSPVIFEMASRKMGVAPNEILHIGDSVDHDMAGAKGAGFKAALLDRDETGVKDGVLKTLLDV